MEAEGHAVQEPDAGVRRLGEAVRGAESVLNEAKAAVKKSYEHMWVDGVITSIDYIREKVKGP